MTSGKAKSVRPPARKRPVRRQRRPRTDDKTPKQSAFPIVGVGASAGGLECFKNFFGSLPSDCGMAFVLIQHLDPTRESLTAELVGTYTHMQVTQAEDGMPIEANHVYVIPPNKYLSVRDRTLRLSAPSAPRSLRMAIDHFFDSLAADQQDNAIGIILSGTGTDGTLGLKEIKAVGGMTMVQDPHTAQHDGMPRSAIAGGCADYILPVEQLADSLLAYVQHAGVVANEMVVQTEKVSAPLATALEVLRKQVNFDFSGYKKGTLRRRIQRRMSLRHIADLPKYVEVLRHDPVEATALFKDMLINVTSFFRQPAAWRVLQEQVIRPMVAAQSGDTPLRVWIPACATGEEAYSLAMVLIEETEAAEKVCRLQVFASDVDTDALDTARAGIYPEGIAAHVSAARLSRFFIKGAHGYRVNKELREMVVFAQQSLTTDPPFSRLDLISCRNLFIYLEPAVQARIIPLLHFALREGGHLFLGSAEGSGMPEDLFEPVSTKWRIYRRVGQTRHDKVDFPLTSAPLTVPALGRTLRTPNPARLAVLAQSLLLKRYVPACVIINRAGEIIYFHGQTADYFIQPPGVPTMDLLAQAREGLRPKLRSAIQDAVRENQRVVVAGIQVRRGNAYPRVKLTVEPLTAGIGEAEGLWLVSLEDEVEGEVVTATPKSERSPAIDGDALVHQLEYELESTKSDLQQTIEDLKSANEELMSVNEEFQSSNEELETSKEELQSLNEELTTANTQLEGKINELAASNNDLDNLLTSTNIATLFLDTQLRIRRFTPAATRLFGLIAADIGRPIGDIAQKFTDPDLLRDAAAVLLRPSARQTEVHAHDGQWYVRQVLPYRTRDNHTEGVVMTFSDVAAEALQEARVYAESIVDTVREPLLVLDADLRVRSANQSFYTTFHATQQETVGRLLYELGNGEWDIPKLRTLLGRVLPRKRFSSDFELEANFASIGPRLLRLNARTIERGGGRVRLVLLAIEDVSERTHALAALREIESRKHEEDLIRQRQTELAHALRISTVGELASTLAHELHQPLSAIVNGVGACTRYVRSGKTTSQKLLKLLDEASSEALRAGSIIEHLRQFIEKGQPLLERTDLGDIARSIPRLLHRELQKAEITLQLDLQPGPISIYADRTQIEQVLVNLMQNAIDAIREAKAKRREIRLRIWTIKGMAEVAVRDTGTGISGATNERLFDPFFSTKSKGMGMGLAISRSILAAHHGRIWVEPRSDGTRGTTVTFALPLLRPSRATPKKRGVK